MSDERKWTSKDAREYVEGHGDRDPEDVHRHAGIVGDDVVREVLSVGAEHYDPEAVESDMPALWKDTDLARMMRQKDGTETLTRAIHRGDVGTASYFAGDQSARSDVSGIKALRDLEGIVDTAAPIIYIWGHMGHGKTDFALLLSQLWKSSHPNGAVATNIRTAREKDEWAKSYGEFVQWLKNDTEGQPSLMIFDEASSHASGRGSDGYEAGQKLGPLVYKIRKHHGGLIIIGHDGKDVHPAVRTLATCIHKEGKKQATVYRTVEDREGIDPVVSLDGIPPTDWRYDTEEATSWSWEDGAYENDAMEQAEELAEDLAKEQERDLARTLYRDADVGVSQGDLADALDRSKSTINGWLQDD